MTTREFWSDEAIICPYCKHENRPEEAHHWDESTTESTCGECGSDFSLSVYKSFTWTTEPIE